MCMDFKGCFSIGDGSRCEPVPITDVRSRNLIDGGVLSANCAEQYAKPSDPVSESDPAHFGYEAALERAAGLLHRNQG